MSSRLFDSKQRFVLYAEANGRCSECGCTLTQENFEADHIMPFSRGGTTTLNNGRALCRHCNRTKANHLTSEAGLKFGMLIGHTPPILPAWQFSLRKWQGEAFEAWRASSKQDFLVVATPGSGKSLMGTRIAYEELKKSNVERVVVVCPTTQLKHQWAAAMNRAGIPLTSNWGNDAVTEPGGVYGSCLTYAQIARAPQVSGLLCERRKTLVIFDELHHASIDRSFGTGLVMAFSKAEQRLCLSGTPWRTNGDGIPFVRYDLDGRCVADYEYGYAQALQDGVVRNIHFPTYEGNLAWLSNEHQIQATFGQRVSEADSVRRLRTALDPSGSWLTTVLRDADAALTEVRHIKPDAAGLCICRSQSHALATAKLLRNICGEEVTIVISDDPKAGDAIEEFRTAQNRWIVAVRMVAEGTDINRLTTLVYATNLTTELFVRQAAGRIVRATNEDVIAQMFIPHDPRLLNVIERFAAERDQVLSEKAQSIGEHKAPHPCSPSVFAPIYALAMPANSYSATGGVYTPEQIEEARALKERSLLALKGIPDSAVAEIIRQIKPELKQTAFEEEASPTELLDTEIDLSLDWGFRMPSVKFSKNIENNGSTITRSQNQKDMSRKPQQLICAV